MEYSDNLASNEQVQIDFQGIELHGLNGANGSDGANGIETEIYPGLEEREIVTEFGVPLRVYVHRGSKCCGSIITYHDLGTNHRSLLRFFNHPDMRVIMDYFTVYHVCAPGHHDTAGPVASEGSVREGLLGSGGGAAATNGSASNTSYAVYGQGRGTVISCFVGVGIGAGANILARHALRHSERVLGLFLVNANAHSDNTYYNWLFANYNAEWDRLKHGVLTISAQRALEMHWFGHTESESVDLIERYRRHLLSLCLPNVAGFIQAYNQRPDLGIQRGGRTLPVQTFLLTGSLGKYQTKSLVAMNARCDPSKTEYLIVDEADGMLIEEQPDKAAGYLLGLLRETGLVAFLTPARVREQAIRLSTDALMRRDQSGVNVC
uniref:ABC transporter domain-containing protein n=1 Tax=Macrostomum lignano TaxID=282301 RepID=A0A1I8HP45_9PLAT